MSFNESQIGLFKSTDTPLHLIQGSENPLEVVVMLNRALADEAVLSMKTLNAIWNFSGIGFFELRNIYRLQIFQLIGFEEEIAKRTQVLTGQLIYSFSEFITQSRLSETPGETPDVFDLYVDHVSIVRFLREDYRKCVNLYEDSITSELLLKIIHQHEKLAYELRTFIHGDS